MGASEGGRSGVLYLSILLLVGLIVAWSPRIALAAESANASGRALTLEGELVILHEDFKDHGRYLYFLKTRDGAQIPLHFRAHPPTNLLTGDHVSVRGQQRGTSLMLDSGGSARVMNLSRTPPPAPTGPLPNTFGAQS